MKTKKVKTSSLVIWLMVGLIFSIIMGVTGGQWDWVHATRS
jgi:hypothetical protein